MKNKKGFTLVELLAVIVILAVIALIAVPIILNMIENSKKGAAIDSAYGFVQSVEYSNSMSSLGSSKYEKIEDGTDLDAIEVLEKIKLKGTPPTSGTLSIEKGRVISADLCIYNYNVNYDGLKAKISGKCGENGEKIEEDEPIIPDKDKCLLEAETIDSKEYLYIDSVEDMYAFSKSVNNDGKSYEGQTVVLRNSLDFTEYNDRTDVCGDIISFEPIGNKDNPFKGTFEGNAKTISNLKIEKNSDYVGLFGYIDGGTIRGINLKNIKVKGGDYTGIVYGYKNKGTIEDVLIEDSSVSGDYYVAPFGCYGDNVSNVLIRNITVSGKQYVSGGSIGSSPKNIIIESGKIYGNSAIGTTRNGAFSQSVSDNAYYSNNLLVDDSSRNGFDPSYINDISFYEFAGLDTYIGGDNDNSGYYFDYNSSEIITLKKAGKELTEELEKDSNDYYLIYDENDWKIASLRLNEKYKLMKNVDFSTKKFYVLGNEKNKFSGTFDGNAKTISNVSLLGIKYTGLFGYIDGGTIRGINLKNIKVKGGDYTGIVYGYENKGTIEEILIEDSSVSGYDRVAPFGCYGDNVSNVLIRNITVSGNEYVSGGSIGTAPSNIIVESANINGSGYMGPIVNGIYQQYNSSYYSNNVVLNDKKMTNGFDTSYIGNLSYYTNKIETIFNGDKNNTGYYFGLDSNNKISLIKAVKNTNSGGSSGSSGSSGTSEFCRNYSCTCDCGCESCGQQNVEFACKSACGLN